MNSHSKFATLTEGPLMLTCNHVGYYDRWLQCLLFIYINHRDLNVNLLGGTFVQWLANMHQYWGSLNLFVSFHFICTFGNITTYFQFNRTNLMANVLYNKLGACICICKYKRDIVHLSPTWYSLDLFNCISHNLIFHFSLGSGGSGNASAKALVVCVPSFLLEIENSLSN